MKDTENEFVLNLLLQKYSYYSWKIIGLNITFRLIIGSILFILTILPYVLNDYIPFQLLLLMLILLGLMIATWMIQRYSLQREIENLEKNIFRYQEVANSFASDLFIRTTYKSLRIKKIQSILSISVIVEPIAWLLIAILIFNLNNNYLKANNFRNKDLVGFDFRNQTLVDVNFSNSNLSEADLSRANLRKANLRGANLSEADLWGADLTQADLREANLTQADLREADLTQADLREADLTQADLREADLTQANLTEIQLKQSKLCRTIVPKSIEIDIDRDCEKKQ